MVCLPIAVGPDDHQSIDAGASMWSCSRIRRVAVPQSWRIRFHMWRRPCELRYRSCSCKENGRVRPPGSSIRVRGDRSTMRRYVGEPRLFGLRDAVARRSKARWPSHCDWIFLPRGCSPKAPVHLGLSNVSRHRRLSLSSPAPRSGAKRVIFVTGECHDIR